MEDHNFTEVFFAVELGEQAFGVELGNSQLLQLLQHAANRMVALCERE